MEEAVLQEVDTYVSRHHNTVTHFIATRPVMELCLVSERCPGTLLSRRWWEQEGLVLEGMQTAAWEAKREEGWKETDGPSTVTETETYDWVCGSIF